MSARAKARKRAMDILYSADVRAVAVESILADEAKQAAGDSARKASWEYAGTIVSGVIAHRAEIDELIAAYSQDWPLDRMPAVDRAILRIGAWEILYSDDVPGAVAIAEAGKLASEYSTEASGAFVNGLLGAISKS